MNGVKVLFVSVFLLMCQVNLGQWDGIQDVAEESCSSVDKERCSIRGCFVENGEARCMCSFSRIYDPTSSKVTCRETEKCSSEWTANCGARGCYKYKDQESCFCNEKMIQVSNQMECFERRNITEETTTEGTESTTEQLTSEDSRGTVREDRTETSAATEDILNETSTAMEEILTETFTATEEVLTDDLNCTGYSFIMSCGRRGCTKTMGIEQCHCNISDIETESRTCIGICENNKCEHGVCQLTNDTDVYYLCKCEKGYYGRYCDEKPDDELQNVIVTITTNAVIGFLFVLTFIWASVVSYRLRKAVSNMPPVHNEMSSL